MSVTLARGRLLVNGHAVEWPPRDMNGMPIEIGCEVYGVRDTCNLMHEHRFVAGALRLQNSRGVPTWVVCAYEDSGLYYECLASDCVVLHGPPMQYRGDIVATADIVG